MKPILGFALPTNEPDTFEGYFLRSIDNLKEVAPLLEILINFQKPWDYSSIDKVLNILEAKGFNTKYEFNEYQVNGTGLVPFNQIREDSARIDPDLPIYAMVDDDMTFLGSTGAVRESAGRQFLRIIHYMLNYQNCGLSIIGSSLYRRIPKYTLAPTDINSTYVTGKGIVVRSMGEEGLVLPSGAYNLLGSDEEKVVAASRLYRGWFPAKMGYGKVRHYENLRGKNPVQSGSSVYKWNSREILEANNVKFVRDNYNPDYNYDNNRGNDVIDWNTYKSNGGIDIYNREVVEEYTINYEEMSNQDILDEIEKMTK